MILQLIICSFFLSIFVDPVRKRCKDRGKSAPRNWHCTSQFFHDLITSLLRNTFNQLFSSFLQSKVLSIIFIKWNIIINLNYNIITQSISIIYNIYSENHLQLSNGRKPSRFLLLCFWRHCVALCLCPVGAKLSQLTLPSQYL